MVKSNKSYLIFQIGAMDIQIKVRKMKKGELKKDYVIKLQSYIIHMKRDYDPYLHSFHFDIIMNFATLWKA